MNLDPSGSPRHEQTVAVALIFIIAQAAVGPSLSDWPEVNDSNESSQMAPDDPSEPICWKQPNRRPNQRAPAAKVLSLTADIRKSEHNAGRDQPCGSSEWRIEYSLMSIKALIVDDSSVMRKIVERSLRQAGIDLSEVFQAGNGAEALGVLKDTKVDLILCDINMPVMDGLEFIKQLPGVENAKGVPVVMITTEGSESHVVQALSCGARGYIRKPFTPEQVKEHVVPVLAGKS
jgi:two-component system, chemotaxis family, chemotaxis protein CheY